MSANANVRPAPTPVTLTTIANGSNETVLESESGSTYAVNPTGDVNIKLPKCSTAGIGTNYKFVIASVVNTTTCTTAAGDVFIGSVTTYDTGDDSTVVAGARATDNRFTVPADPEVGSTWSVVMVSSTQWYITGHCKGNNRCFFS